MMETHVWFGLKLAEAHLKGLVPHGPSLPKSMPWKGDIFFLENKDGTDTFYTWWGDGEWLAGPDLKRPKSI